MEIIQRKHHMDYYTSRLWSRYFSGMKVGVFDIETLGLNPSLTEVILAGFLEINSDGRAVVTQYFASEKNDEQELLTAIMKEMNKYDVLLTYNGKHFDIPFIMKRAELKGLEKYHPACFNLDLYLILHGHSTLKQTVKSLKQKNVEDYMGLHTDRKDEISGADSILLYEAYLEEQDSQKKDALKQKILLHNHDDILQLYRILPVIRQTDFHRAMTYLGFPVQGTNEWPQLNIGRIRADHTGLAVTGSYSGPKISYISYDDGMVPYSCSFSPEGDFQFLFYTRRHKSSHYLELSSLLNEVRFQDMAQYPGFVNGFLILTEGRKNNFLEINMFVQNFLQQFMEEMPYPLQPAEIHDQISFL